MKLRNFALALTAAALLPTFAYAGTDAVVASFERDMYREPINSAAIFAGEPEPFMVEFNTALYGTTDLVLASFERDMYREPVDSAITVAGEADSLTVEFYAALRDVLGKPAMHATAAGNRLGS